MQKQRPSLRSRLIEWVLWRLRVKKMFNTQGLRERVLKSRPKNAKPPRSIYRRFEVLETRQDGRPVFTLRRKQSTTTSTNVLYLHGGAYVYEMMSMQWTMLSKLLDKADLSFTVPIFPLAPEHTVQEILPFVRSTYDLLLRQDTSKPITLMADSAGGGLAIALAQQLRDSGRPQPKSLILLSPWLDVTCSNPGQVDLEKLDPVLSSEGLREEGRWYAGELAPTDTRVSPLFGDLTHLPPMLVLTGTHDLLHTDATRLQAKLEATGGAVRLEIYRNMLHVWPSMPIPEAKQALQDIVLFLSNI